MHTLITDAKPEPELSALFASLSDPTRLRLLLIMAGDKSHASLCVCALAQRLGISQPACSQHLRVLRTLGLVSSQRCGMRVHYGLDRPRLAQLQRLVCQLLDKLVAEPRTDGACQCHGTQECCHAAGQSGPVTSNNDIQEEMS